MQEQKSLEDIERAVWYARLAFGIPPDQDLPDEKPLENEAAGFDVLP